MRPLSRESGAGSAAKAETKPVLRRSTCVLTRFALQMVRLILLPIEAAGPSRSRLYLHRARLVLRDHLS